MRLKKLEIYGFKSFADRVEMIFPDGVTGVVGPNGSGKSNIGDAVRWVLGEQSAKTLRGAKMEDVIFGGTEKRKAQAYCEVSLVFGRKRSWPSRRSARLTSGSGPSSSAPARPRPCGSCCGS